MPVSGFRVYSKRLLAIADVGLTLSESGWFWA